MGGQERRFRPPSVGVEVEEELAFHVEMRARELVARGWPEEEARAEAIRRFGDLERVRSDCRELGEERDVKKNRRQGWEELRQDLAYSLRQLRRSPGFAGVAIFTLALAIGATAAVFSVLHAVLLRPLPYPEPDRLAAIWTRYLPPSGFDIPQFPLSGPEALDYREASEVFESIGIWNSTSVTLTGEDEGAARVPVARFSREMFEVLGVAPLHGRTFTAEEDRAGAGSSAVLGHDLWVNRFGADPAVVGRAIHIDGESVEVVGIMPAGFAFPSSARAWIPLGLDRTNEGGRGGHGFLLLGRLATGRTLDEASAELDRLNAGWAESFEHNVAHFLFARDLKEQVVADAPRTLALLFGGVGLVLLIACANIANLLLVRAERRHAEVGVRAALGAGRGRIARQLITESLVLSTLAAGLGLLLAAVATPALVSLDPTALPRLGEVGIGPAVIGFTLVVAVGTALLFGIAPAWISTRRAVTSIASTPGRSAGTRGRARLRRALVGGEVALSVVVVILAGLMGRSLTALASTDPGLQPERVLTFGLSLPGARYPEPAEGPALYQTLLERVGAVPGVVSVAATSALPFSGSLSRWDFQLDDRPPRGEGEMAWNAQVSIVTPGYFETLGIPLLEGRSFERGDGPDAELVGIVSERMAQSYWPGESALGKRWGYAQDDGSGGTRIPWIRVVGVVRDQVRSRVDEDGIPQVYLPLAQSGISGYGWPRSMSMTIRTGVDPLTVLPSVRRAVAGVDPDLPLAGVALLDETVRASLARPRLTTNLLGVFGLLALVLAAVGIYGVVSYAVAGRTREIGVRVALGAERGDVTRLVLGEGSAPLLLGLLSGIVLAWWAGRLVESLLFGVPANDPLTFALLPAVLLAVGIGACLVPALRATRIAPTEALRED